MNPLPQYLLGSYSGLPDHACSCAYQAPSPFLTNEVFISGRLRKPSTPLFLHTISLSKSSRSGAETLLSPAASCACNPEDRSRTHRKSVLFLLGDPSRTMLWTSRKHCRDPRKHAAWVRGTSLPTGCRNRINEKKNFTLFGLL